MKKMTDRELLDLARRFDAYAILGIPQTASSDEIKKRIRLLQVQFHPDKHPGEEKEFSEKFKQVGDASEILCDSELRLSYDHALQCVRDGTGDDQTQTVFVSYDGPSDAEVEAEEQKVREADEAWEEANAARIAAEKALRADMRAAALREAEKNRRRFLVYLALRVAGAAALIALVIFGVVKIARSLNTVEQKPKIAHKLRFYIKGNQGENKQISIDAQMVAKIDNGILLNNGLSLSKYPTDDDGFLTVECEVVDLRSSVWDVKSCVGPLSQVEYYPQAKPYNSTELIRSTVAAEWVSPATVSNAVQQEPRLKVVQPEQKPNASQQEPKEKEIRPEPKPDTTRPDPGQKSVVTIFRCPNADGSVTYPKESTGQYCTPFKANIVENTKPPQQAPASPAPQVPAKHAQVRFEGGIPSDERLVLQELADAINFGTKEQVRSMTHGGIFSQFGFEGYGDLSSKGSVNFKVDRTRLTDGREVSIAPHSYVVTIPDVGSFQCQLNTLNNQWQFKDCFWYEPEPEGEM